MIHTSRVSFVLNHITLTMGCSSSKAAANFEDQNMLGSSSSGSALPHDRRTAAAEAAERRMKEVGTLNHC
jgi:hypothetical protein